MGERKFTAGPWQVSGVRQKIGGEPMLMVGPDSAAIAAVFYSDRTTADHVASHADATLIASAPDLLEALESAEEALTRAVAECGLRDEPQYWLRLALEAARAAIARAKGKG